MADFDLTQTDAQVQSILNDAQNAQGAGAQTTLTTDYIMLKDTSGNYHKILKDSFTEACRNVLAGLLVNNDKGTTISQIPAIASGDFGSVTPANLASVLGGVQQLKILSNDYDIDDLDVTSCCIVGSSNTSPHKPSGQTNGTLLTVVSGDARRTQSWISDTATFFRQYDSNYSGGWYNWQRVDNFGCNTSADLASLLGGTDLIPCFTVKELGINESASLTLSSKMYVFVADNRIFNGIKIIIGATNTFKTVDSIETQSTWDSVFSFEVASGNLKVTNLLNQSVRLRYYVL